MNVIRLSNGYEFEYVAASGALGFDGQGWPWEQPLRVLGLFDPSLFKPVTKSLTWKPRRGNLRWHDPFRAVRFIDGGVVNAVDLTNLGFDWWLETVGRRLESGRQSLIVSIYTEDETELRQMAERLNDIDLAAVELNAHCPNHHGDFHHNAWQVVWFCELYRRLCRHPLILKVSVLHNLNLIVPKAEPYIEAIDINSVPWSYVFPHRSPLRRLGGGAVSGQPAQAVTWSILRQLVNLTDIPVIGPSVWRYQDIQALRGRGAQAISFGSIFLRYPWRPTIFVRRDQRENGR
ncbi:MAG: hypothetical protein HYY50_01180 [Candidatus Kerfeldbacteria bacterium]|nr:hypothetical protein [Candidatus Kerfeldbacteria bacterium]